MAYKIILRDIPYALQSKSKKSAFTSTVANWCRSQNIRYELIWDEEAGRYYKDHLGWQRSRIIVSVEFKTEEDFLAFKLMWY